MKSENNHLPKGWIKTELEICVQILDNKRVPINSSERAKRNGNIPYYGATGQVGWIDDHIFDEELVLLGEDGAPFLDGTKNKAYLITGKSWVNNHAHVLKGIDKLLLNSFLCHYLNQIRYKRYVKGTTRLKLNQSSMKKIPIILPPFNEQNRVVTKIESIFSQIDASRKKLEALVSRTKSSSDSLTALRSSILKQAFEGKLVSQDPHDEPAELLLKKINKNTKKLEFKKNGYPKGWINTTIESVCEKPQYGYTTSASDAGTVKLLRTTDITSGQINWETVPYCKKNPDLISKYLLKDGDIVISRAGSIGHSYLISHPPKSVFASYLIRFKPLIYSKFFSYFLHSNMYWNSIYKKKVGIALQNVNATKLKQIQFPLPPLSEQKRIVAKIESIFGKIDAIEKQINDSLINLEYLKKSILKKAFEGKLVMQDPNDESAHILLKKILKEKSNKTKE